jgi:hypothetical protein
MTYLCLVYFEPERMEGLSHSEKVTLDRNSVAYDGDLSRSGHYIVSHALQPVSTAKTVRAGGARFRKSMAHSPRPGNIWAASS